MVRMGMDAEVVSGIGRQLTAQSQRLGSVLASIENLQRQAGGVWEGADLDRFQHEWSGGFRVQLKAAVDAIAAMGQSALTNAQEQLQASGDTGTFRDNLWFRGPAREGSLGHARDLADIAEATYGQTSGPPGWVKIGPDGLKELGFREGDFGSDSGMSADLFINEKGEYVLSFRGTDTRAGLIPGVPEVDSKDAATDAAGAFGVTEQDRAAVALALKTKALIEASGSTLEFTGHSLGGRLAALSSIATGGDAVIFNAAGTSLPALAFAEGVTGGTQGTGHITAISTTGDWLTTAQEVSPLLPDAPGAHIWLDGSGGGDQHGIDAIREGLRKRGVN